MLNLGQGTFGYVVKQPDFSDSGATYVAAKRFFNTQSGQLAQKKEGIISRWIKEELNQRKCKYLVKIIEISLYCIKMECFDGNIGDYSIFNNTLSAECINYLCYQGLSGLNYLHSLGIVHGDLSKSNILYKINSNDPSNYRRIHIVLSDFGNSVFLHEAIHGRANLLCTRYLTPPEYIDCTTSGEYGKFIKFDHKVDIWALGIVLLSITSVSPLDKTDNIGVLNTSNITYIMIFRFIVDCIKTIKINIYSPIIQIILLMLFRDENIRPSSEHILCNYFKKTNIRAPLFNHRSFAKEEVDCLMRNTVPHSRMSL